MANLAFDATAVDTSSDYDLLPAGDYLAVITDSEEKTTKAGTGSYIELSLEIIDGPKKGRKLWDRLNLNNPNPKAVTIAQQTLARICLALDMDGVGDSSELHNKPLMIRVGIEDSPGYGTSNKVKSYGPANQQQSAPAAPQSAAPSAPVPPTQAPTANTPPWA